MQTSGLILDFHDDLGAQVFRQYSSEDQIPEAIKTAQVLSEKERQNLPDDVYALVLVNGHESLRKYACVDRGSTHLNVDYFLQNYHKLPEEAQKVAAANLCKACSMYKVAHPQFVKLAAIGIGLRAAATGLKSLAPKAMNAASHAGTGLGVYQTAQQSKQMTRQAGSTINPNILKTSEASFTHLMPAPSVESGRVKPPKAVIRKVGACLKNNEGDSGLGSSHTPNPTEFSRGRLITTPKSPGGFMETAERVLHPHIEVTGKDTKVVVLEKKATTYALRSKYPLDDVVQVKKAAAYFDAYGKMMPPEDRHEYCVNMTKRAEALGIPVSDHAKKYGAQTYAPEQEIKVAFDLRRAACPEIEKEYLNDNLAQLWEKRAQWSPEAFCRTLGTLDEAIGLDHLYDQYVPDPFWSTYGFGFQKEAEYTETLGNQTINASQLQEFAKDARKILTPLFASDLVDEFCKDPVGIFKSLPLEQKLLIMRRASAVAAGDD